MKINKLYIVAGLMAASLTSCNDFLTTAPNDALSPSTTWQTETDADKFLTGCYDGWEDGSAILYWDCGSDFGYNNFSWEGFKTIGNGSFSPGDPGWSFYDFTMIRRCNTFLDNIDKVTFSDESTKKDMIAQVKAIRAYRYFVMCFLYGGVPIIDSYSSAQEAQVPRNTEAEVQAQVFQDLNDALADINETPSQRGRIAKGAVLAMKMRASLYWGDYEQAKEAAQAIIDLGQYSLDPDYSNLFTVAGQDSEEIILAVQYITGTHSLYTVGQMYNNSEGGWSSMVPTQNCIDNYEMSNGLTIEEDTDYDPFHPFYNRDPRMAMTIIYPGEERNGTIFNPYSTSSADYYNGQDNASKTCMSWRKYLDPKSQYSDMWDTNCCPIVFRYAEVLLTWAEAENELNGPSADVYDKINQVRERVGMPDVDETKYATQDALRTLIRRERSSEFAGEGLRRADIVRWKDSSGKMVAETVMNGDLMRSIGTVDESETEPTKRATITSQEVIESRTFQSYNRYFPIPQDNIDANPMLEQNPGYSE